MCKFRHTKFIGNLDTSAKAKLSRINIVNKSKSCIVYNINSLVEPFIKTGDGVKTYSKVPEHRIKYLHHTSLSYIGQSYNDEDKETCEFIKNKIINAIIR